MMAASAYDALFLSLMTSLPEPTPGLAVSLGAAFLGFYTHAGFLQGLAERGVWPEHLAGCSSGAVVAGLAATGLAPERILEFLLSAGFRWGFFEPRSALKYLGLSLVGRSPTGMLTGRKAIVLLQKHCGAARIEDLRRPTLAVSVTNLTHMQAEMRSHGPLAETMIASCAFPGIFQVQALDGGMCWDGGIANGLPVSHWENNDGVRRIVAHSVQPPDLMPPESGPQAAYARAMEAAMRENFALRARALRAAGRLVELATTKAQRPGFYISQKAALRCFEAGRETGRTAAVDAAAALTTS